MNDFNGLADLNAKRYQIMKSRKKRYRLTAFNLLNFLKLNLICFTVKSRIQLHSVLQEVQMGKGKVFK